MFKDNYYYFLGFEDGLNINSKGYFWDFFDVFFEEVRVGENSVVC